MVRRVVTRLVSDLSGATTDVSTVTFSLDSSAWTVELTAAERVGLEQALEPYVAVARRTSLGKVRRRSTRGQAAGAGRVPSTPDITPAAEISGGWKRSDLAAVRAWAKENGWPDISDRGRVPPEVLAKYDAR